MKRRRLLILFAEIILAAVLVIVLVPPLRARACKLIRPKADIAARVAEYGSAARARLRSHFDHEAIAYPPASIVLVGLKSERVLEVYAPATDGTMRFTRAYPILAASGKAGPKLAEGDNQVPEGVYRCESLNPNSLYHLALRVGYPSEEDLTRAKEDGRDHLGGDIMIHGSAASVGCLAMGDPAIEELFVLAADVGVEHVEIILSPVDFRRADASVPMNAVPPWIPTRYDAIRVRLAALPRS